MPTNTSNRKKQRLINFHSPTKDAKPLVSELAYGEIAITHNIDDRSIYTKYASGTTEALARFIDEVAIDKKIDAVTQNAKNAHDELVNISGITVALSAMTYAVSGDVKTLSAATVALKSDYEAHKTASTLASSDKTVTITTATTGTDLSVNIDGATLKQAADGKIQTDLSIATATTDANGTVLKRYQLVDSTGAAKGVNIDIPKDRALLDVKLTKSGATVSGSAIADGNGADDVLAFLYETAEGKKIITEINVASFLRESEFKDGLQVSNGEVSVQIDTTNSDNSIYTQEKSEYLQVGENGIYVKGIAEDIKAARDAAISASTQGAVTSASTSGDSPTHIGVKLVTATTGTTVVIGANDIASATGLTAETKYRKDVTGVQGDAYTASTTSTYIKDATSLYDADTKLDKALNSVSTAATSSANTLNNAITASTANTANLRKFVGMETTATTSTAESYAGTNYIATATTMIAADKALDAQAKANADAIGRLENLIKDTAIKVDVTGDLATFIDVQRVDENSGDTYNITGTTEAVNSLSSAVTAVTISNVTATTSTETGLTARTQYDADGAMATAAANGTSDQQSGVKATVESHKLKLDFSEIVIDCGTY